MFQFLQSLGSYVFKKIEPPVKTPGRLPNVNETKKTGFGMSVLGKWPNETNGLNMPTRRQNNFWPNSNVLMARSVKSGVARRQSPK